jgi:hypothetical protein
MSGPIRVLFLGAGQLSTALRLEARERSRLDGGQYGAGAACLNLGQMRQVLEVWRGQREIPEDIQVLCANARRIRVPPGSTSFRDIDVAVLEPVSPVELVFRGYSLSWRAILRGPLVSILALGPDEARLADRWLRAGLLASNEGHRAEAAAELFELVPSDAEGADFAKALILETRSQVVDAPDALRTLRDLLGRPMGVIVGSPEQRAAEEAGDSGDSLTDKLTFAAVQFDIPTFRVWEVGSRRQADAPPRTAAHSHRFSPGLLPGLADAAIQFIADVADSASDLPSLTFDGAPSPFFKDHVYTRFEEKKARANLAAKDIRLMPFPFNSALAIVSDLDGSQRPQYEAYTGQLIGRLGLDFGDSTWLQWAYGKERRRGVGFGFLSPDGTTDCDDPNEIFNDTRTFFESLAEFHIGNVDHFHSFFIDGPRVVISGHSRQLGGGKVAFDLDFGPGPVARELRNGCIVGVCAVTKKDSTVRIHGVAIEGRDGVLSEFYGPAPYDGPRDGRQYHMFSEARPQRDNHSIPKIDQARSVIISVCDQSDAENIERVIVSNTYGIVVMEALRYLNDVYHIDINLITEHGAHHFRNPAKGKLDDEKTRMKIVQIENGISSGKGTILDARGDLIFSTDADHPNSMCRVFPEITSELELRFIVPAASSGGMGFSPFELVTPSPTRAGGGVYWAKRVMPRLKPSLSGEPNDRTRQSTFTARVEKALEVCDQAPGLFWPLYTHLGALDGDILPEPYFNEATASALQDRAFNISGAVAAPGRVWVGRASVIYDYALILRSIGDHVTRPDANSVRIGSWRDPVIGKRMPRSRGQLYGLTFYVDDPSKADVRLDGEPIETFFVNPADETGRPSITIAECDIRHLLFDNLDPARNRPGDVHLVGGQWTWRPRGEGDRAFGRLAASGPVRAAGTAVAGASLTVALHGWTATGAQSAIFAVRRHGAGRFALEFQTQSGGRFCFGDRSFVGPRRRAFTASYAFDPQLFVPGVWRTLSVPFYDLAWHPSARPGGPLPSHALESVTIHCLGDGGAAIDVAGLAFLRPRASRAAREAAGFCVGGRLAGHAGHEVVHLSGRDRGDSENRQLAVDQRGFFCFDQVARGMYEVWADTAGGAAHDRRGPLLEVEGDTMTLVLGAGQASGREPLGEADFAPPSARTSLIGGIFGNDSDTEKPIGHDSAGMYDEHGPNRAPRLS